MGLEQPQLHVIDFEGNLRTGVIESGFVTIGTDGRLLCRTSMHASLSVIPAQESRTHGIYAEMLRGKVSFSDSFDEVVALRRCGLLAAHNSHVESNLLRQLWPAPPWVPAWDHNRNLCADWGPWIDTLRIYRRIYPDVEDYRLSSLIKVFNLSDSLHDLSEIHCPPDRRKPHCALFDALAASLLLLRLFEVDLLTPAEWPRLLAWSGHPQQTEWTF